MRERMHGHHRSAHDTICQQQDWRSAMAPIAVDAGAGHAPESGNGMHVDLFAGGGGASLGIEMATGKPVGLAINHDPAAIRMHAANHPSTEHRCEGVQDVDPAEAIRGRTVQVLWASPSCTHFSRARGSAPVTRQLRALGWQVPRWAAKTRPRLIVCENVPEWRTWGPVRRGQAVHARAGEYWRTMIAHLRGLGYRVDDRDLVAADYGAPTTRRRLFLIARLDAAPAWPMPTHGRGRTRYRSAAECLDWSDLGTSIFTRKRPLAPATCRRIAAGIVRYVLNGTPYLVRDPGANRQRETEVISTEQRAVVSAFLAKHYTGVIGQDARLPIGAITAVDHHSLVSTQLMMLRSGAISGSQHRLCASFLTTYYSCGGTANGVDAPMPAVVTKARHGLVSVDLDGITYGLTDIRLRMLQPRELARAQGFPDHYLLTGTKAQQIARIGNSVCPMVAQAIIKANC